MLNYKNDPWLFDSETVNDLINKENILFLDNNCKILNLFSALIKKGDFVKNDKISQPLQKTAYVKVTKRLKKIIDNRFDSKNHIKLLLESY